MRRVSFRRWGWIIAGSKILHTSLTPQTDSFSVSRDFTMVKCKLIYIFVMFAAVTLLLKFKAYFVVVSVS